MSRPISEDAGGAREGAGERIALDVHAHLVPMLPDRLDGIAGVAAVDRGLEVDGRVLGPDALYRPEALIAWMSQHGVDRALVSAPPPAYRPQLEAAACERWTAYLNDGLREMARAWPERLHPALHLPVAHPDLAASVARAALRDGARVFAAPAAAAGGPTYADPALTPLWQALDDGAAFVFVHPGACCDGRLHNYYLENLLGNPYETAVTAAHLVLGGVVERYPNIDFCLAHGGGATAMVAGRWQRGFDTRRPGIDGARARPGDLLRRLFVDCIVHDRAALDLVAAVFGAERILFGSDWPFPMGLPLPRRQLAEIDPALRRRITGENAARLGDRAGLGTRAPAGLRRTSP